MDVCAVCEFWMFGLLDFAVSLDSCMAATLTLYASRKMLSSICLMPIPLAFHLLDGGYHRPVCVETDVGPLHH